jgi:hypothetical protein
VWGGWVRGVDTLCDAPPQLLGIAHVSHTCDTPSPAKGHGPCVMRAIASVHTEESHVCSRSPSTGRGTRPRSRWDCSVGERETVSCGQLGRRRPGAGSWPLTHPGDSGIGHAEPERRWWARRAGKRQLRHLALESRMPLTDRTAISGTSATLSVRGRALWTSALAWMRP